MMASWEHGANVLIWYFRAVCNGQVPLNMDWNKEAQQAAKLDLKAQQFLSNLRHLLSSRGTDLP